MKDNFEMIVHHPDKNEYYWFNSIKEYKKWQKGDYYRRPTSYGGSCSFLCRNKYTERVLINYLKRQDRYYKNKKLENLISKKWRLEQKIKKLNERNK